MFKILSMEPSSNFKRADWTNFSNRTDHLCTDINATNSLNQSVQLFTDAVLKAAKKSIPRGKRQHYRPTGVILSNGFIRTWTQQEKPWNRTPTPENIEKHSNTKDNFLHQKKAEIQKSWNEKTSSLNMEKDTTQLWNLTKLLNEDTAPAHSKTVIEENGKHHAGKQAANILADFYKEGSTTTLPIARTQEVNREIKEKLRQHNPSQSMTESFTIGELNAAIKNLKSKKAVGKYGIPNDMIKHLGKTARQKLLLVFNQSWNEGNRD